MNEENEHLTSHESLTVGAGETRKTTIEPLNGRLAMIVFLCAIFVVVTTLSIETVLVILHDPLPDTLQQLIYVCLGFVAGAAGVHLPEIRHIVGKQ